MPLPKPVNTRRLVIKKNGVTMRMLVRFSRGRSKATVGNRTKMAGSLGVKGSEQVQPVNSEN